MQPNTTMKRLKYTRTSTLDQHGERFLMDKESYDEFSLTVVSVEQNHSVKELTV